MPLAVDDLEAALEKALGARISGIEQHDSPYRSFNHLEDVDVSLADGSVIELVLKDLSRTGLEEEIRRAKPAFLYDPLREIEIYESVLGAAPDGAARCYCAVSDEENDRYLLVLERVNGDRLSVTGNGPPWLATARWLGALHSSCKDVRPRHALVHSRHTYERWFERARTFVPELETVAAGYVQVIERLLAEPPVFLHGEFYASNVLVVAASETTRVCPVDWEMASVGPGILDVAALTAGSWSESERTELALAYRSYLPSPPPEGVFLESLAYARLQLAVQWLGWSSAWSPPSEHAHDWLDEALATAEQLGLAR